MEIPLKDQERKIVEQLKEGSKEAFYKLFEDYSLKFMLLQFLT